MMRKFFVLLFYAELPTHRLYSITLHIHRRQMVFVCENVTTVEFCFIRLNQWLTLQQASIMFLSEIIFSNKALCRITRHLVFWLVYTIFFYLQSLVPEVITVLYHSNAFYVAWVSVYCFLPACIFSVYVFLYFLLPAYLQKKKFIQFST